MEIAVQIPSSRQMTPEPGHFHVSAERLGADALIVVEGELDIATLPEFERAVTRMRAQGLERMVIDLRQLEFLDSMSIELLLRVHHELEAMGAGLVVVRGPRAVNRVFDLMELQRVLTLVDEPPELRPS
jgi:anti-sigma B factor antagonist